MSYIPTIPIKDLTEVVFADGRLLDKKNLQNLKKKLEHVCKDGNLNKNKHQLIFQTDNGQLKVHATVWMVGKKYVLFKENLFIPINSIIDVS
jgi:hypothetical protein